MVRCNLCGETRWQTLEEHGGIRVVRCRCGLVFLTPQPERLTLEQAYDDTYYDPWQHQSAARRRMWDRRLRLVERLSPPPSRLLDVGAGDGTFLQLAKARGWKVFGTEFSASGAARATRSDIPVAVGEVWEISLLEASQDLITCWHVIEHVRDPRRVFEECLRILRPGGWLLLATPNLHDRFFQLAYRAARGRRPQLYEPDERELHLFCFSAATLKSLALQAGFENVHVGFDLGSAVTGGKRLVNAAASLWYRLTRLNWGMGLLLTARRPL